MIERNEHLWRGSLALSGGERVALGKPLLMKVRVNRWDGADSVQAFHLFRSQIPANGAQIVAQLLFIPRANDQR